ncbi:JmjC domain-containing protein 4-like [Oopsacas minuta]|uniref:Jumonji domain-containing protein 4 n=1 Tax=Oopsacas minuta TaxID=111878 RepID=A0AAV7JNW4_9METZ|nr:JmjC domain-containing protein 4-like [Oopsacas minuta]
MEFLFQFRENLLVEEFFSEFLYPNRPCLISNLTTDWNANEWCNDDKIHFDFLKSAFGELTVPVANCDAKEFNSNPKSEWLFKEYLSYWQHNTQLDLCRAIDSNKLNDSENCSNVTSNNLYLKDWHFTRDVISYSAYKTPLIFTSDWLNEFYSQKIDTRDDYKFVYMGTKGTWTPLHYDVFRSYSWSSNVVGTKMWILFPSGDEVCLKNIRGELVYNVMPVLKGSLAGKYVQNILNGNFDVNEHFREFSINTEGFSQLKGSELFIKENSPKIIRVVIILQRKGETIFVPSGWHHQVHNLDDVISVNHNWINACNVHEMWDNLSSELDRVKESISDCIEMEGWHAQCQLILLSLAGMNYSMFCEFILIISLPRLLQMKLLSQKNSELHYLIQILDHIIKYISEFLIEQKEFKFHSNEQLSEYISTFVPSPNNLDTYLPPYLSISAPSLHKHIIFIFFELSRILSVLKELIESKDFELYINNSELFATMNAFFIDLTSIWTADDNNNEN